MSRFKIVSTLLLIGIEFLVGGCGNSGPRLLQSVSDEIENDFFPHVTVDVGNVLKGTTIDRELQPGALGSRTEDAS
jgi:hypothetical protein